jgi:N6-adenosine-specific RNA methylase IME4
MNETSELAVSRIVVGKRIRKADPAKVAELAASIGEVGLLNPITVAIPGNHLVAGLHRLEAARSLGWKDIPATVLVLNDDQRALAEIDENLIRNDLTVLQRSEHLAARKAIYERLHPEAKAHSPEKQSQRGAGKPREIISPGFTTDTHEKTKLSVRTIQHEVQIGSMPEAVREAAAKTASLADSKTDLLLLSQVAKKDEGAAVRVAEMVASGEAKSVKDAVQQEKRTAKAEVARKITEEGVALPSGPFRVLVVDPPWKYDARAEDDSHRARNPYPDMTTEEIKRLPVASLAHADSVLWLWTTNAFLRDAFDIAHAWGFTPKTVLTWDKEILGLGDWLRNVTEHCLLCVRGRPVVMLTNQTTMIRERRREHSRKPEAFYSMVEKLCPGNRVELFARAGREGWSKWGAESEKFDAAG